MISLIMVVPVSKRVWGEWEKWVEQYQGVQGVSLWGYGVRSTYVIGVESWGELTEDAIATLSAVIVRAEGKVIRPGDKAYWWACEQFMAKKYPGRCG